ncbi:MAG: DNA repair protein RadA [bacterium]|nr:DNA repair protein RadA [bacterium]
MPLKNKQKILFACNKCSYTTPRWLGKCPDCGAWNSFEEEVQVKHSSIHKKLVLPTFLAAVGSDNYQRFSCGINEIDRVLGGGLVVGSFILLGGAPGIGKSTLLLQLASLAAKKIFYVSGEESLSQIKMRADRLNVKNKNLMLIATDSLADVEAGIKTQKPDILIIDSIQTIYHPDIPNSVGTVTQIKEVTNSLLRLAKSENITIFLVGHITKDGNLAGPKVLEHMVDVVLYFEDDKGIYRIIRGFKNRFGNTSEIAVFEMTGQGLLEVSDPDRIFYDDRSLAASGSVLSTVVEGSRALNIEVQALVTRNGQGIGRRQVTGIDVNRLFFLLAVLEKRLEINLYAQDVFINLVGGIKVKDISLDLAICAGIISSYFDAEIPANVAFLGEVGLGGEIRPVNFSDERENRLKSFGVEQIITHTVLKNVRELLQFVKNFSK